MILKHNYRFYPTETQKVELARTFGCVRFAYNFGLRLRTDSYKVGKPINFNESSRLWTLRKREDGVEWLNEVSSVPLQQALRNLQGAFVNFFEKRAKYPTFKKKQGKQSATYTHSGFTFTKEKGNRVINIAKIGKIDIQWTRAFKSEPSTVTITKDRAERYFVSIVLDETPKPMAKTNEAIGIDLGINRLATLSNGERIANPRYTVFYAKRLARAQRVLARRVKGSGRRNQQRIKVACIQAKIGDARKDNLNKLTTNLVRRFDRICIEDLNVRGMVRNHCLAKSITDASFGAFRSILEAKARMYGKQVWYADRFFPSSKRCNQCGYIMQGMSLEVREWDCPECKAHHDRDENAAKNILKFAKYIEPKPQRKKAVGLIVSARGGNVRPVKSLDLKGSSRRSVNNLEVVNA